MNKSELIDCSIANLGRRRMKLLVYMLEYPKSRICTDMINNIYQDGRDIEPNTLTKSIEYLRKIMYQDTPEASYILTLQDRAQIYSMTGPNNLFKMNFLITGAAGFLGSALANHLAWEGHQVRRLDDLSAGDRNNLNSEILFTRGDVNDRPKLWTLLQDVDCVYHLAARVSVPESIIYPREYNAVNVGTVSLMEAMRDVGVKRVVLISSGAVYGDQQTQPLREGLLPNPRSPYAVSKLAAESYVRTIGDLWGIDTVSLRVFNAYGPGQHLPASHPPLIPNLLRQSRAVISKTEI